MAPPILRFSLRTRAHTHTLSHTHTHTHSHAHTRTRLLTHTRAPTHALATALRRGFATGDGSGSGGVSSTTPTVTPVHVAGTRRRALYAGTFDPPSCGHLDIIRRALSLCDGLVIAVAVNPSKKPIFSDEERAQLVMHMVQSEIADRAADVEVEIFQGLIVDCARRKNVDFLVRGLRAYSDFEYEFRMALINRQLTGIETSFLMADQRHSHISSTLIREMARWKTTLPGFVPDSISETVYAKMGVPYNSSRKPTGAPELK